MKRIIFILILGYFEPLFCKKIVKPIGLSYQVYPECVAEAKESLHPFYYLKENFDYIMDPIDLLVWWRFDIVAKYIYALHRELLVNSDWAKDLYLAHEKVWSDCHEADGSKTDCEGFLSAFDQTLDSIKKNGFDPKKGKIKIDISKYPCDGSHRIASCILYNNKLLCRYSSEKKHCTYSSALFFKHYTKIIPKGLDQKYLDAMAFEYCKLKNNTRIIVIPNTQNVSLIKKTIRDLGAIVYEKEFYLSKRGINNLFDLIHFNTAHKPIEYKKVSAYKFFLCEFDVSESQIQKEILNLLTPNSLYIITTDIQTTINLAQMLLLENSIDFLNNRKRKTMMIFPQLLSNLEETIVKYKLSKEQLCIVGAGTQAAYGIKDCKKLQAVYHSIKQQSFENNNIIINASHEQDDIIFNPMHHFYYKGYKFAFPED